MCLGAGALSGGLGLLLNKPGKVDQPSISQATKTLTDYVEAESVSVTLLLQDVIRVSAAGLGSADCTHFDRGPKVL